MLDVLGLPAHAMTIDGVEYFGGVGFLKAGLRLADRITTRLADLRARDHDARIRDGARGACWWPRAAAVEGIVNGIDDVVLEPGH